MTVLQIKQNAFLDWEIQMKLLDLRTSMVDINWAWQNRRKLGYNAFDVFKMHFQSLYKICSDISHLLI